MSLQRSNRLEWLRSFGPVLLWVAVIFYLSSGQGSSEHTSRFITPFLQWLFPGASVDDLAGYHKFIRKCAHVAVYAVLGSLAARALIGAFPHLRKLALVASCMIFVLVIASLDEWNQSFNAARTSAPTDVLFDALGGLIGTGIYLRYVARDRFNRDSPA